MSKRSKLLTWGLPIAGIAALGFGGYTVAADRPVRNPEAPPRMPTTAPGSQSGAEPRAFIGAIGIAEPPGEAIKIAAHIAGVVESVEVGVGDTVRAGQTLLRIDGRRAQREIERREAAVAVASADLAALRGQIPTAMARVDAALALVGASEASVASANAALADLVNRLRVAESVDDPRAISAEEVDSRRFAVTRSRGALAEAESRVGESRASLAEASARLSLLVDEDSGRDGPDIEAAKSRLLLAEAELASARTELDLLEVKSPVDGVVIRVNTREGEFAEARNAGEGLVTIARSGPAHVRVQIDEVDIPRFSAGARAWGSPRGAAQVRLALQVALIEPLVTGKTNLSGRTSELVDTRVLEVVYRLEDDKRVFFGQQLDVYIEAQSLDRGADE